MVKRANRRKSRQFFEKSIDLFRLADNKKKRTKKQ